ncbi:MAG: hypothetical protein U0L05_03580 [Schaedlerella sp.]|nr:hypothetical protein [Schaedlerella sp.]
MKLSLKRIGLPVILATSVLLWSTPVQADEISDLENKTGNLEIQLDGINQELLKIGNEIYDTESEIERSNNELIRLEESLAISRQNEEKQYEEMKGRIRFMYENNSSSVLEVLFSADSMADLLNVADFIQSVSQYDREKLDLLQEVKAGIEAQETALKDEKKELIELQKKLEKQEAELTVKAAETSTDLATFKAQLQALREEEARRAEEERKKAEESAAANSSGNNSGSANTSGSGNNSGATNNSGSTNTSGSTNNSGSTNTSGSSGNGGYNYPTSGGVLTPEKGVVYYNGHRETYYSQKVLPGGGLSIPGRHVASDGTIRDKDGYICVASSDHPKGTLIETSLGMGKVYDTGCDSGTIDVYTDW